MSYLRRLLARLGGVLIAPRETLRAIAAGQGGDPLEGFLLFVFVQLCITGRVLYRNLMLSGEAPEISLKRAWGAVWSLSKNDLMLLAVVATALVLLGRFGPSRRSSRAMAAVAGYLVVPVLLLKIIGATTMWLGHDQWWLPHHPIDSYVVFVNRQLDWVRFLTKCGVAYGWSAILLVDLVIGVLKGDAPAPREPPFARFAAGVAVAGALLLAGVGSAADVAAQAEKLRPTLPGDPIPEVKLSWLSNKATGGKKHFDPTAYRGQVLLLDFWASWCKPCRRSMPEYSALYEELKDEGLQVVGINREPYDRKTARVAYNDLDVSFPSAVDVRGFGERLGLTSLPTAYLVDRQGVLRYLHLGYTDPAKVRAEVEELLAAR